MRIRPFPSPLLSALLLLSASSALVVGCSSDAVVDSDSDRGADTIANFDDPDHLLGTVSRKLADNISAADVGQTFGVVDDEVPYPDTYWPMTDNGIDVKWNAPALSPLEKYMSLADKANLEKSRAWNQANAGKDVPGVQGWFGICHGWTGAAIAEKPLKHGVSAKLGEGGRVETCAAGSDGCFTFEIGDLNALMATVYADGRSKFVGARCDTAPADIKRDADGRIDRVANGAGCKGLNPGALLMVLNHRMKRDKKPMAIDAQTPFNTNEIWNQPAYRYTVHRYEALTEAEAANLVAKGTRAGELTAYKWNDAAKGFALVDLEVHWVTEHGPNTTFVSGLSSTRKTRVTAVVELDRPASDPSALILGGEYLDDATSGANRLTNHPFVWLSTGPGPETAPSSARSKHNPYIKTSVVQQLVALAQR